MMIYSFSINNHAPLFTKKKTKFHEFQPQIKNIITFVYQLIEFDTKRNIVIHLCFNILFPPSSHNYIILKQMEEVKAGPRDKKKKLLTLIKEKGGPQKTMISYYAIDKEIGNGVSSRVYSAVNINTGEKVAIKKIKNFLENKHESLRILREILLLRKLKHPNIINLREIVIEGDDPKNLSLILDYLPSDIKKIFSSNAVLDIESSKRIIFQILLGLHYLQQCQVLHRDLKPQNVLTTPNLSSVKLCDFGLARAVYLQQEKEQETEMKPQQPQIKVQQGDKPVHVSPHMQNQPAKVNLTAHVSTRWYRAPQLIILERKYSNAIDIWSVGCIMGELLTMNGSFTDRKPLFPGKACYPLSPPKTPDMNYKKINDFPHSVHDQLSVIFSIIGTPTDIDFISDERAKNYIKSFDFKPRKPFKQIFKNIPAEAEDFLLKSLEFNPNKRMTIAQALNHKLFDSIRHEYEANMSFKGQPISMQLQGIDIDEIRRLVLQELKFYQQSKMKE